MKVLAVEPDKDAYIINISNELSEMQDIIEGYIQVIQIEENVVLVCNEEGKLIGLRPNRAIYHDGFVDIIAGNFFLCECDGENFTSISDENIEKYRNI